MKLEEQLLVRSGNKCELCLSDPPLVIYEVSPRPTYTEDSTILICEKCEVQIQRREELEPRWNCLTTTMWSEIPGIKVVTWRLLNRLKHESWAADNLDLMYLEDDLLDWAKAGGDLEEHVAMEQHLDSNGSVLQNGDTILLTRTLEVKGAPLNAKMGTVVKNIRLVEGNTKQIEGKIEGQMIVILTQYVRKQGS